MKVHLGKYDNEDDRNVNVHIDYWDTWNLDQTLAEVIHPALIKLKEEDDIGIPYDICRKVALDPDNMTDEEERLADKLWHNFLEKMIWSFSEIKDNYTREFELNTSDPNYLSKAIAYRNRIQEGLNLFAEYYMGLWT